jgi:hypothetical protein
MSEDSRTVASTGSLAERMAVLNVGDVLLPPEFLLQVVLPQILASFLALLVLYNIALLFVGKFSSKEASLKSKRKICYQFTNLCANVVLSLSGLYFEYWSKPSKATEEESTQGYEEFVFMSCFQMVNKYLLQRCEY